MGAAAADDDDGDDDDDVIGMQRGRWRTMHSMICWNVTHIVTSTSVAVPTDQTATSWTR